MEKLNHRNDGINAVYRAEGPDVSGACGFYVVTREDDPDAWVHTITFQQGARKDEDAQHGVVERDLLEIVLDRLKSIQEGSNASKANGCAITYVEGALGWLDKHKEERIRKRTLEAMED